MMEQNDLLAQMQSMELEEKHNSTKPHSFST
jgi:hypothetical protein